MRRLLNVFRRHARWVVVTVALIVTGGLGVYLALPPRYEAKAQILLDPQGLQVLQNDLTHGATAADAGLAQVEIQNCRVMVISCSIRHRCDIVPMPAATIHRGGAPPAQVAQFVGR